MFIANLTIALIRIEIGQEYSPLTFNFDDYSNTTKMKNTNRQQEETATPSVSLLGLQNLQHNLCIKKQNMEGALKTRNDITYLAVEIINFR